MVDPAGTLTFLNEARVVVVANDEIRDLAAGEVVVKVPVIAHAAPATGHCSVILTSPSELTRIPLRRCDCDRCTLGVAVVEVPPVSLDAGLSAADGVTGALSADAGLGPISLRAMTETVYAVPLLRPVTVQVVVAV